MGFDRKAYMKKYNAKYREKNKKKLKKYNIEYKENNKEIIKEKRKKYHIKNSLKISKQVREVKLKTRYGITKDQYNLILVGQDFKCAICGKEYQWNKKLDIDHNHNTGEIRGLLCGNCNRGLGLFKDNVKNLKKAINYLNKNLWKTNK